MIDLLSYPNPILSTKSLPYSAKEEIPNELIMTMFNITINGGGLGLAAPQVGINKRLIVLLNPLDRMGTHIINPRFTPLSNDMEEDVEGCLSVPGIKMTKKRYSHILVDGRLADGKQISFEAKGILARVVQHEIDHLDGKLIIDDVNVIERLGIERDMKETE